MSAWGRLWVLQRRHTLLPEPILSVFKHLFNTGRLDESLREANICLTFEKS